LSIFDQRLQSISRTAGGTGPARVRDDFVQAIEEVGSGGDAAAISRRATGRGT
jgi:hypothetical protein